jgi:nitrite reductase/ring-hydroxylating ferredoxin subunit/CDGSH-type Zn-finger protein
MDDKATITPTENGPLHVRGPFQLVMPSGRILETEDEVWLCRCGASGDKPFCDGSHERIGFVAPEPVAAPEPDVVADDFQPVGHTWEVGEGELLGAEVAGKPVVIGRVGDRFCAIAGLCTHHQARLADGTLDGEILTCPLHNGAFNIVTGAPVELPVDRPAATYEVRLNGDTILVACKPSTGGVG